MTVFADDLTWLTNSPGWQFFVFLFGTAIGVLSLYIGMMSFRDRKIRYALRTNNLMRGVNATKMPGATVTFAGFQNIENLSVTRLALWNAGRGGVTAADVVKEKPLVIRLSEPGAVILSVGIIQSNRPDDINKFRCEKASDGLSASVDFDFMDHNHGIVVQIFHTAVSHKGITMDGYVKGMGEPKSMFVATPGHTPVPPPSPSPKKRTFLTPRRIRLLMGGFLLLAPLLVASLLLLIANLPPPKMQSPGDAGAVSVWVAMPLSLLLAGPVFWPMAYWMLRPGVPKELSMFEEDF